MLDPVKAEQFAQWIEMRGLRTPISQVVGFQQFTAQVAPDVLTSEGTTSATYTDLATVGPSLNTLGNGKYLVAFGFTSVLSGSLIGYMSPSVNGSGGSDTTCAQGRTTAEMSVMRIIPVTLASGTNTIVAKYRSVSAGNNVSFLNRWMIALRYGN